ncbi:glucose-6-phosphate dehydrogenase [Streptococcus sp. zg-86]|uniref:Glucose-6-phosphate 1-dehydrogenase n=1 Tax=Streptococcus zhangguiae TaxID=2664091 RepID=A0A6I4RQW0_9STRE|nr:MULTISPECIES: glucose-6-phosphate dehydrogenase [unclassified Streptococcus]MTB64508.1 glucose-6-phosphate dehydrogenase [Streptococcus sp. zg-86]MTB90802.1 glucose-6-phosphate dehydrogenase [Streptococcus sp. zg-36]MWV56495.1 glucose-6-phosphate dehydrogenase [Streptococcus sp. zg-70]QTH47299.1 glucose-6-phosphate dehydrogenase [Streptococcus sp. zg-86]
MSSHVLFTIFGASGDLAKRKLYPSLFRLYKAGHIGQHFAVIGTARRPWTKDYFEQIVIESLGDLPDNTRQAHEFASHFYYQSHDVNDTEHYIALKQLQEELGAKYQTEHNKVFFLSMAPEFFGTIAKHLKSEQIVDGKGFERLIIEKPFGTSLETAEKLNQELSETFEEEQIYRIDHYLGKEMVQNIFAVRFANIIFEHIWNRDYIESVQINFAESIGVEDRGGYYDHSGALKDMIQNHALQVLSLLAMDKPTSFKEADVRAEKIKVFQHLKQQTDEEIKRNFIRGQYTAGHIDGKDYVAYLEEPNIVANSQTETFASGVFFVDTDTFRDVPFFFRTGKRLTEKGTRITIVFKQAHDIFGQQAEKNILTIYIQPTEGFSLSINGKEVGSHFALTPAKLDFRHNATALGNSPEAYEKLFFDVLHGDSTNFSHWEEVKASWQFIDQVIRIWQDNQVPLHYYPAGSMGPQAAFDLLESYGSKWVWTPDVWYRERGLL